MIIDKFFYQCTDCGAKYNRDEEIYIKNLLNFIKITKKSFIKLTALIEKDDKQKIDSLIFDIKKGLIEIETFQISKLCLINQDKVSRLYFLRYVLIF